MRGRFIQTGDAPHAALLTEDTRWAPDKVGQPTAVELRIAMLWSFCVLLACQAIGNAIQAATGLPIPGTILGISVLVALLACRRSRQAAPVLPAADALLPYLSLMFVPPGVVAVLRMRAIPEAWLATAIAIVVSSALALAIAGRLAQALLNHLPDEAPRPIGSGGAPS